MTDKLMRQPVEIGVTPLIIQDQTVVCELEPGSNSKANVKSGLIRLKRTNTYQLQFQLDPAGTLQFDQGQRGPFWCNDQSCPTSQMNNSNGQLKNPVVSNGGFTLTLDADPSPEKNAIFYALNFDNGGSFDPIIIHD